MTAFTTTSSSQSAAIFVHTDRRLSQIKREIYSGFTEHMGRCIYGGIYDPDNPNPSLLTSQGFRKDVLDALRPLEIPIIRYPGGNFCATYHWQDGVGPRDQRPKRPELAWEKCESNRFGTDEFMEWCKELGTEPYLCLNFGTGTLDEALAWLEYCNSASDTYYANLRRKNGHAEPYGVKYWALGNEMWGPWQINQMTQEVYAERAIQWAKALKLLDPSIKLVLCGKEGPTSWDYHTLKRCLQPAGMNDLGEVRGPWIDMHSIHLYTASLDHYENVTAPLAAERSIEITSALIDLAMIENRIPPTQPRPTVCLDEWNVWLPRRAPGSKGAEEHYNLSDALAVAVWLNVFVRRSRELGMACIAQTVNVLSPLMTSKEGITKQTTWCVLELFCKYVRGWTVSTHVDCATYEGSTKPDWVRNNLGRDIFMLDVSAAVDEEKGNACLCVVNMHQEDAIHTQLEGIEPQEGNVQVFTVTGESIQACNMNGNEEVVIKESSWVGRGNFSFPKHSFTLLRWRI